MHLYRWIHWTRVKITMIGGGAEASQLVMAVLLFSLSKSGVSLCVPPPQDGSLDGF